MKFENIRVYNFEHALRGMRNPKESYHLIDSEFGIAPTDDVIKYCAENDCDVWDVILYTSGDYSEYAVVGPRDLQLAQALIQGGPEHRKFLRQIFVTVDITAPLYWWKEFDTYKVGTVSNSTSTMHTIHKKPFTIDDFSFDKCNSEVALQTIITIIDNLNILREQYLATNDKAYWYELIQLLPSSFNQTRMCTLNYETLINQYYARKSHKTVWNRGQAPIPDFKMLY